MKKNNWIKLDKCRYENTANAAFIAKFNWSGERVLCVYINREEYQKGHSDYKSFKYLKDAKAFGNDIENSGLIRVHT